MTSLQEQNDMKTKELTTQHNNQIIDIPTIQDPQIGTLDQLSKNRNQKEIQEHVTIKRQNSELTIHSCWLCNQQPKQADPFVNNCQCTGSNHIHANCLSDIILNNYRQKIGKNLQLWQRKKTFDSHCSICKFKYKFEILYGYQLKCKISSQNKWYLLIALIFLLICSGISVLAYYAITKIYEYDGDSSLERLYRALFIILAVFCIILGIDNLIIGGFLILKSFLSQNLSELKIISSIKDKLLLYSYDQKENKYVYKQDTKFNSQLQPFQVSSKIIPQDQQNDDQLNLNQQNLRSDNKNELFLNQISNPINPTISKQQISRQVTTVTVQNQNK